MKALKVTNVNEPLWQQQKKLAVVIAPSGACSSDSGRGLMEMFVMQMECS